MILILFLAPRKDFKRCQSRPKSAKTMLKQAALITFATSSVALQAPNLQVLQRGLHTRLAATEPTTALERGAVLRSAVAAVVAAVAPTTARAADAVDYKAVAADVAKIIKSDPDKGPTFLRLAWHSSGAVHQMSRRFSAKS